jgi:hypothetical protein
MKKISTRFTILITLTLLVQPSFASADDGPRFSKIKGNYLISYSFNEKTSRNELYNHLVTGFSYGGNHYQSIYVDSVTPLHHPIQSYDFHAISKNLLTKELKYFLNLAQNNPSFGQYENTGDRSVFAIEGRYAGKEFLIKIPDANNYYLDTDVNSEELALRIKTIERIGQLYNPILGKRYTPKQYFLIPGNTVNLSQESVEKVSLKTSLQAKCQLLSSVDSRKFNYSGNYQVTAKGKTANLFLNVQPYIPNLNIC